MALPIVSWYNEANTTQVTSWNIGTVDAGSSSDPMTMLIWNNRGGTMDVSDMQNCTITTKDENGGNTGELVLNTWIGVKVDSMGESTYTYVGGDTTHPLHTDGETTNDNGTFQPGVTPHASSDGASIDILGIINKGELADAGNYVKVTLMATIPTTATAGTVNFLTRCAYQYT